MSQTDSDLMFTTSCPSCPVCFTIFIHFSERSCTEKYFDAAYTSFFIDFNFQNVFLLGDFIDGGMGEAFSLSHKRQTYSNRKFMEFGLIRR